MEEAAHGSTRDGAGPRDAGEESLYQVGFTSVKSFLIVTQRRESVYTGTLDQLERTYARVRMRNLLFGWWGIPAGIVWTSTWLHRNRKAIESVRDLASSEVAS
jgi:hypothetical protein